jgi:hypothetical protein
MSKGSSHITRSLIALSLVMFTALWLIGAPRLGTPSRAQTPNPTCLTVKTGNGTEGGLDSQIQWSPAPPAVPNFVSATIVPPFVLGSFFWDTIPGTQWVSIDSNRGGANFQNMHFTYRTTFTLPASYSSPSISIQVHCDNVAQFFLNGNGIGGQTPDVEVVPYFQNPPESATSSNAAFFHPGVNTLTVDVHNFTDATGLDFLANICYLPPAQGCIDEDPPAVSCNVAESQLWPANHDLVNVGLTARITDDCDCFDNGHHDGDDDDDDDDGHHHGNSVSSSSNKAGSVGITSGNHHDDGDDDDDDDDDDCDHQAGGSHSVTVTVYSDEPDLDVPGSGNFSPDAKDIGLGSLRLRSERSGNADGRVYLIVVKATDASGKIGYCVKTVTVPHDQSNSSKNSVIAQANAAKAYFMANHVKPPNYVQVGIGPVVGPKQ